MSTQFLIEGQKAWYHKDPSNYGYFHTYDALSLDGDTRKIQLFLPSDYESKRQKYPAIIMNDGQTAFHNGGLSPWSWEVDKTVDKLTLDNIIDKVIIVAVYPVERNREYLPEDNEIARANGSGNRYLPYYSNYLANLLLPFLRRNYFIDPNPEKTAIVGSSFGGVASFYTASKFSDSFGIAGIMSPSFCYVMQYVKDSICPEKSSYMNEISTYLNSAKKKPSLWIDWGKYEEPIAETAPIIIRELQTNYGYKISKNLFYYDDPLGTHDERAWKYRFGLFLKTFYLKKQETF